MARWRFPDGALTGFVVACVTAIFLCIWITERRRRSTLNLTPVIHSTQPPHRDGFDVPPPPSSPLKSSRSPPLRSPAATRGTYQRDRHPGYSKPAEQRRTFIVSININAASPPREGRKKGLRKALSLPSSSGYGPSSSSASAGSIWP